MVSAHSKDRVQSVPCDHNPEEEQRVKRRVRRNVEPPEVRRFLRQELLIKVGHSWWNRSRVYRYDRDDEREPTQSLPSVVVVPPGQEQPEESLDQQELGPAVSGDRMTLVGPVASPVTSFPHTPGRDIVVAGSTEESPRTREGRLAAATLEQEIGRRSVAEAIRPNREQAVAREQRDSNREPASKDGRDRSPGRTSSPAAEVGVDAQTPEGRIPKRNRAEAGVSPVQP